MRVAIYETVHLDWIIPYADILSNENITVDFVTSSAFQGDLQNIEAFTNKRYTWHFFDPGLSYSKFSSRLYAILKSESYDLVILNSVDSRLLFLFVILTLLRPKRVLINLHDINNFFKLKFPLNVRTLIRSLGKKLLTSIADGYIVNAKRMKLYIQEKQLTQKSIYWLQPVYYIPSQTTVYNNNIVVTGSIDKRRRDYKLVLEVIRKMLDYKIDVTWTLAGKPVEQYGLDIIDGAKELNTLGARISFFADEILENEFQEIVANSSIILSPLVTTTAIHDDIVEVYGETKGSGNIYDAIRHAKPIILPKTIVAPEEITSSCVFYDSSENLVRMLVELFTNTSVYSTYRNEAKQNSLKFSKEKIKKMFMAALEDKL